MRKFLDQKFWSHGTPLGSLGPLSFQAMGPGACQCQILVIWGPCEHPVLVAPQAQAKYLKTAGSRCGMLYFRGASTEAVFLHRIRSKDSRVSQVQPQISYKWVSCSVECFVQYAHTPTVMSATAFPFAALVLATQENLLKEFTSKQIPNYSNFK